MSEAAHGRASAVATGIKRVLPDKYVFSYQVTEILQPSVPARQFIHANRGENILIIFINNGIYGMTGGRWLHFFDGTEKTNFTFGRDTQEMGYPLKITELILRSCPVFITLRKSQNSPVHVRRAKKAIYNGFKYQELKKGLSFVEIVTNCPSNWKMTPVESNKWFEEHMLPFYQLGDLKVPQKENLKHDRRNQ